MPQPPLNQARVRPRLDNVHDLRLPQIDLAQQPPHAWQQPPAQGNVDNFNAIIHPSAPRILWRVPRWNEDGNAVTARGQLLG